MGGGDEWRIKGGERRLEAQEEEEEEECLLLKCLTHFLLLLPASLLSNFLPFSEVRKTSDSSEPLDVKKTGEKPGAVNRTYANTLANAA